MTEQEQFMAEVKRHLEDGNMMLAVIALTTKIDELYRKLAELEK